MKKPRLAIVGFTACSGCQLTLLNCEEELLQLADRFDFAYFPLASSPAICEGEYDAAVVEGCITTASEESLLQQIRARSATLVAIGTCAAWGGVPAMPMTSARDQSVPRSTPRPLHNVVKVDATIPGCPPEKAELLSLLSGLLRGVLPATIDYPVCTECRMKENLCLLTEQDKLCLGAVTSAGCNARCPSRSVACEGCRGPISDTNISAALECYAEHGYDAETVMERLARFYAGWKR